MAKRGRIEARVTIPTGGAAVSYTDSAGGPLTATVPAGNYTGPTAVLAELVTQIQGLTGAVGANFTASLSAGESGTGLVTMDTSDEPWSLTWTSTNLRDLLGYTANISSVTTAQVGTKQAKGLWLPDVEKWTPRGDEKSGGSNIGVTVTDTRQLLDANGTVQTLGGTSRKEIRGLKWVGVSQARTLIRYESVSNESFEQFWLDTYCGSFTWFLRGARWTIYWDADLSITTVAVPIGLSEFDPATLVPDWVGRFIVEAPLLSVVP